MALTIEVDSYQGLETLEIDILEATKGRTEYILNKESPVKVELHPNDFKQVEHDLKAFGSYEGIRHESEIMSNKWQLGDVYVVFTKKKLDKEKYKGNGSI
ncbi:hypothetical protein CMI37_02515 [Candidatus Pacearchaeota archaeon]|nr:hypothetical protein [Candidatus Pacearchaeota archaeon]|tara:strand:- start:31 stop:330 length:300 start_codon:yes stop_codon:yes gene_type:complete